MEGLSGCQLTCFTKLFNAGYSKKPDHVHIASVQWHFSHNSHIPGNINYYTHITQWYATPRHSYPIYNQSTFNLQCHFGKHR